MGKYLSHQIDQIALWEFLEIQDIREGPPEAVCQSTKRRGSSSPVDQLLLLNWPKKESDLSWVTSPGDLNRSLESQKSSTSSITQSETSLLEPIHLPRELFATSMELHSINMSLLTTSATGRPPKMISQTGNGKPQRVKLRSTRLTRPPPINA